MKKNSRIFVAGHRGLVLGREDPMEKDMATHSSILAWSTSWAEEPGGLQSIRLKRDMTEITWHSGGVSYIEHLSFLLLNICT